MSFWEDRFVNRPHASAVPPGAYTDPHGSAYANRFGEAQDDGDVGSAWSDVSEPVVDETEGSNADDFVDLEPDASDEAVADDAAAAAAGDAVYEYRRSGLFRRRKPVLVEAVADDETYESEAYGHDPEVEVPELGVDETELPADEFEPAPVAEEAELFGEEIESSEPEPRRRGLFRRRKDARAEAMLDDEEPSDDAVATGYAGNEPYESSTGMSNGWSLVSEPAHTPYEPPAEEVEDEAASVETYSTEFTAEDEHDSYSDEQVEYLADEPQAEAWEAHLDETPVAEAPVEDRGRRGLFRRRKHVAVEPAVEDELEPTQADGDDEQDEAATHDTYWAGAPAEDSEPDEEPDELAAFAPDDDAAVEEKPQRRSLFRRRKPEPVESIEVDDAFSADEDDYESVEDDSFGNEPYYVADASDEVGEQSDATGEDAAGDDIAAPDQEEPDAFVMEHEDDSDTGAAAEAEPDPSWAEPEPVSEEPPFAAEAFEQDMPVHAFEEEPVTALEGEPVQALDDEAASFEHEVTSDVEASEAETPVDPLAEEELQRVAAEWHDAESSYASDEVEETEDFVPEPMPAKRNGGGSARGRKIVGLKVGASQIAAAVVVGSGDRQALVDVARRPLEQGVVVDGELRDREALVRALRTFFKEHGLPSKNVYLGLSSSRVGVRTFDISGIEDGERFDNAVRFKAHEVLPVAAHESVLDYRVVEERYTESGETSRRVLLVVAPRDQVEPYVEACREAGLRLAGLDLEAFGLLRAFVPPFGARSRSEDSATVVAAIGHESSTLLVAGGGVCEFTRVFDWGGGALQTAIADELDVPPMEAATILTHLSLDGPGRHLDSLDADSRSRALEAVRTRLMPFARELVSSLQFYQTQPESLGIREILITGGTSHLEGLADALHQMIGVNVSVGDPLARVDVQVDIPSAVDATIGSLAVPIGLAIEDEDTRSVNLLPKESREARKKPNTLVLAAALGAALPLLLLAFLFVKANGSAGDSQAELDALRVQITALPQPTKPNIDPALVGEQAARATAVAQILGGRLTWERVLGDISRVLPESVSLTELTATAPQPTTPEVVATTDAATTDGTTPVPPPAPAPAAVSTTPTGVSVTGYALDYATIARALARIQAVPSLTNAELQSATPNTIGKKRIIEFIIVAQLAVPGGAQ